MKSELHTKSRVVQAGGPIPRKALLTLGLCTLIFGPAIIAQQQGPRCPTCPIVIPARPMDGKDLNDMRQMNDRKRDFEAANAARKRLIDDEALRLLILARDLKQKTDNLGGQPPSRTMEKEAAMIEFLANDVKEKMKLTVSPD